MSIVKISMYTLQNYIILLEYRADFLKKVPERGLWNYIFVTSHSRQFVFLSFSLFHGSFSTYNLTFDQVIAAF